MIISRNSARNCMNHTDPEKCAKITSWKKERSQIPIYRLQTWRILASRDAGHAVCIWVHLVRLWWCWIISFLGPGQPHSAEVLRGCLSQAQHWSFIFHEQVKARRGPLVTGVHTSKCTTNDPYFNLGADEKGEGEEYKRSNPACAMPHCPQEPDLPQWNTTQL